MKTLVIISFTEQGGRLNQELRSKLEGRLDRALHSEPEGGLNREVRPELEGQDFRCESYTVERFADRFGFLCLPSDRKEWLGSLWGKADFVFIGAVGIAVRYIAPWVKDKYTDSAVISIDETGKFVIPVLSGHVGGGVEYAEMIAACLGAVPVVTTATDIQGRFAVDVFARKNGLHISSRELAKKISAAVLEGKQIGFYSAYPVSGDLPAELEQCGTLQELKKYEYGIAVADRGAGLRDAAAEKTQVLFLPPRNLIVGIGCRKGIDCGQLKHGLETVLRQNGKRTEQIARIASIDIKKEEPGLRKLSEEIGVPFWTYSADELKAVSEVSETSEFVRQVTGVDNVCERAAMLNANGGRLIQAKIRLDGMTFAVAEEETEIRF